MEAAKKGTPPAEGGGCPAGSCCRAGARGERSGAALRLGFVQAGGYFFKTFGQLEFAAAMLPGMFFSQVDRTSRL